MFSEEVFGDRAIDTYLDYSQNELFLSQIAISRDGPSVDLPPAAGVKLNCAPFAMAHADHLF